MRKLAIFGMVFGALAVTGCSKTDEQLIVQACLDSSDDASEAFCTCTYEQMASALPPETLTAIAEEIRGGAETPQDAISELPQAQQFQTLAVLPKLLNCVDEE